MRRRILLSTAVLALLVSSCVADTTVGSDGPVASVSPTSTSVTTTASVAVTITTVITTASTSPLVGSPIDFGPRSGDVIAVIGVPHDDALNLRAAPGPTQDILDTIDPVYEGLVAQGETWEMPTAFWVKVDYEGTIGWVHMGFIAYLGHTDDATATVVADLGGNPAADSMEELGCWLP